jgi:hypothetical protein
MMFNLARNIVSRTILNIHVGALIQNTRWLESYTEGARKNYKNINMNITNYGEQETYGYLKNLKI